MSALCTLISKMKNCTSTVSTLTELHMCPFKQCYLAEPVNYFIIINIYSINGQNRDSELL